MATVLDAEFLARRVSELESALALRTRELADARREMARFADTVSHDLRAPVRGVTELARFTLQDLRPEAGDDMRLNLESIVRSGERLAALTEELLRQARKPSAG